MNKIKATKKEMRQNYRIASIGYCDAQYLLNYQSPIAYSEGNDGWHCDYYYVDNVVVCTGYQTIPNKNTNCTYDLVHKYDKLAQEAKTADEVNALLKQFIAEIIA
jgi:predicted GNAT superfamily acetyltransferase